MRFISEGEKIPLGFSIRTEVSAIEKAGYHTVESRGKDGLLEGIMFVPNEELDPHRVSMTFMYTTKNRRVSLRIRPWLAPHFIWRYSKRS